MREARPPLLLVRDVGYTVEDDATLTPTAVLDVDAHPEISDLARVHAIEGMGDVRTSARRVDGAGPAGAAIFLLGISLSSPVRAACALAFPLPETRAFLIEAGAIGRLALATTSTATVGSDRPVWLAINLDAGAISRALG